MEVTDHLEEVRHSSLALYPFFSGFSCLTTSTTYYVANSGLQKGTGTVSIA